MLYGSRHIQFNVETRVLLPVLTGRKQRLSVVLTRDNIFYGATVVANAARITHTFHHCQLSDTLTVIIYHQRILFREIEREKYFKKFLQNTY